MEQGRAEFATPFKHLQTVHHKALSKIALLLKYGTITTFLLQSLQTAVKQNCKSNNKSFKKILWE